MRLSGNARFTGIVALALAAVTTGALTLTLAGSAKASPASSGQASGGPAAASVYSVPSAAQSAARTYWTPASMQAATGAAQRQQPGLGPVYQSAPGLPLFSADARAGGPPRGTPSPTAFSGVRTVGALFYTTKKGRHFCTGSVVNSSTGNLVLTAAHCVYSGGYSSNLEFVPGYDAGAAPYGAWPVKKIIVASGWREHEDPSLDYAYLEVATPADSAGNIQSVTGGLSVGFTLHDAQSITVIGYNDTDEQPIRCSTKSFKFDYSQMEFYCKGFWYGTSGGPWIIGYNGGYGSGTVFGVIGGYEAGGSQAWASYSAIFWRTAPVLFKQAESAAS
jgi:V8-like Glu-specific endopeptidase